MAYAENLQEIRDRKLHYVIAGRQPERDEWLDEFEDEEGFELVSRPPSPQNRFQKKSLVRVKAITHGKEKIVLCTSLGRTAKDRAIREKQEGRFLADLERLKRRIAGGRLKRELKIGEAIGRLKSDIPGWPVPHDPLRCGQREAESDPTPRRRPRPSSSMAVICCGRIAPS